MLDDEEELVRTVPDETDGLLLRVTPDEAEEEVLRVVFAEEAVPAAT
jgi:hypothetical protein